MNQKKGKQFGGRLLSWLLVAVMLISLVPGSGITAQAAGSEGTSTLATSTVTGVFGNNGYPYGKEMSASSVTLVADLAEGVNADSVQWQTSSAKNGTYSNISGATELEYTFTPTVDNWYRCVVSGMESYAIKIINNNNKFYITNESMAYTVSNTANTYVYFDVVGYFNNGWQKTSYSNGWQMITSTDGNPSSQQYTGGTTENKGDAKLDALKIGFDPKKKAQLLFEVDLASDQCAFSFGSDVQIGTNDSAPLSAIMKKDGTVQQVQMVSAESIDKADETTLSLVLNYTQTPSKYWLGSYGSRCFFGENTDENGVVNNVVNTDSGMTSSWMNLSAGSTIKFNFSVGSVSDTGASIGTTSEATSKSITYKELTEGYEYMLQVSIDGGMTWNNVSGAEWVEPNADNSLTYCVDRTDDNGVKDGTQVEILENTSYKLICRKKDGDSKTEDVKGGDVTTNVDPTVPDKDSEDQGKITIDTEWNTITLGNVRNNYEYQLQDEYGDAVTEWLSGNDEKKITFSDLDEETTYYLVAKETDKDSKSDQYPIMTPEHPRLNLTYVGNFGDEEVNVPDKVEAGVPWKKEYTLSDVEPKKSTEDKYQFIGWSTKADAAEAEYQPGDKVKFDQDTTLYAIWKMPLTYTAEDVNVTYDGQPHNIKVTVTEPEDAVVTYGTNKDAIKEVNVSYTDVDTYTIWYQITAPNYQIVRGSKQLTITKVTPTLKLKNKICMKDGETGTIDLAVVTGADGTELAGGNIIYTYYTDKACTQKTTQDNNGAAEEGQAPTKKGTYYVKAVREEDKNYNAAESNVAKLIIAPDVYFEDEDGNRQYCSFEDGFNPDINTKQATVSVVGNTIVDRDVTVPDGFTLEISSEATLTIPEGVTFTNNGSIFNDSKAVIDGSGTFENNGTVTNGTINAVVRNNGTLNHTTLGNTVTNRGKIIAPATNSDNITNEKDGTVVTSNNKAITRTITFNAKNGLSDTAAEKVTDPDAVSIPWGNTINTITLPVISNIEDTAQFEGWYLDEDCTKLAKDETKGVNKNIILYAKWKEYGSYEAYWTDKSGEKHYGSWDEILKDMEQDPEDVDEVHIQNPVDIDEDTKLPDGAKLYVDAPNGEIQLEDGVQLEVPGGIDNDGTIKPKNDAPATKPTIKAPVDNKKQLEGVTVDGDVNNEPDAKITDATITGDLKNDGAVTDSTVDGNVTNNETGKLEDVTVPDGKLDNSGSYSKGGEKLEYTVTFMVNGESDTVEEQTKIPYAGKAAYVRPELAEGQVFSGWYENKDYTKLWKFDQNVVVKNLTLYAKVSETAEDYVTSWKDEKGSITYGSLQDALDSGSEDIHIRKNCTIPDGTTIPKDVNVTVDDGVVVTIPKDAEVKVDGDLTNNGTISNSGTLSGNGTLDNKGIITGGQIGTSKVINEKKAEIRKATLTSDTTNNGTISDSTIADSANVENNNQIVDSKIDGNVSNGEKGQIKDSEQDAKITKTVSYDNDGHGDAVEPETVNAGDKIKEHVLTEEGYVFLGWYLGENLWNFDKNTVTKDITLTAKWIANEDCEASWTDEDDQTHYGTWKDALESGSKDIHIQNDVTVSDDITIPEDVTVTVDPKVNVKLEAPNGRIEVNGNLHNEGTITGDTESKDAQLVIQKPGTFTNGSQDAGEENTANITDVKIDGDVTNHGTMQDATVDGNVENTGKITGSTVDGSLDNNGTVEKSNVSGSITNQSDGKIDASNLTGDVTNQGTITGGTIAPGKDGDSIKNEPGASIEDATISGPVDNKGDLTGNDLSEADVDNTDGNIYDKDEDDAPIVKTQSVAFVVGQAGIENPDTQKVEYGKLAKGPKVDAIGTKVVAGWYTESTCSDDSKWSFLKNVVKNDITLYAKWVDQADCDAFWTEDDAVIYGSLDDAMNSGSKDITIKNNITLPKDFQVPEGTTVTIAQGVEVTVPKDGKVVIDGTIHNNGTIENKGAITDNNKFVNDGKVNNNGSIEGTGSIQNNKAGSIYGGTVTPDVENNGKLDGTTLNGKVENKEKGKITDSTLNGTTTNEKGGMISDSTLNGDTANDGGIGNCTIKGKIDNQENGKIVNSDYEQVQYTVTFDNDGHGKKPEDQVIGCGAKVKKPVRMRDADYVFVAWYQDKACTKEWNFANDTVNADTTLYAKWNPTTDYDVYWTNADGEKDYGTLEDAVKAGGKDIHIQKSIAVSDKVTTPEDATVTVDKDAILTITGNGQLEVPGGLVNEGTIQNTDSTVTPQIIGKVENASGATIKDAAIAGDVKNEKDGQITDGQITGKVDNNGNIEKTNITGDVNNAGSVTGAEITGNVTNEGAIENSDIKADNVTNKQDGVITGGIITGKTAENQPEVTNAAGATISGTDITGKVDNAGTLGSEDNKATKVTGTLTNTGDVQNTEVSGTTTNNGTISDSKLEGETTNNGTIDQSTIEGKVTNEKGGTITAGAVNGETTNNGTISGSAVGGNVTNNGSLEGITTAPEAKVDNKNPDATMTDAEGKEIAYKVTFDANGHGTAPEAQTVAYGKVIVRPADLQDDTYTMRGWYKDKECENAWDFEKDVVTGDLIIYAKWSLKTEFEATWTTEDGQEAYGTFEDAIAAGAKDIHIQKDLTIQKDTIIPEGTTVTVEDKNTVTIPEGVTVTVPAGAELINNGTIKNQSKIDGNGNVTNNGTLKGSSDSIVNTTVINNGRVSDSQLNGSVENNGVVKDTTLNGSVKNNNSGKLNDCEINAGLKNNGKVTKDGDEVVYEDQTVKGMVTKGDNKESVDSTTITFQQGSDKKVGSGEVKDGFYQVDKLPNGYYNVVIPSEDGSKVNTFFVKVTDDEIQMKEFNLPDGNLSDQVVVKDGTPKIVVDGLAQMLTDTVDQNTAGVTSEDQGIAKNGGDVDVTFTATQIAAIPDDDVDLEKVIKEDNKTVGMNLDLSVLKTVTTIKDDDTTKTETYLKELNKPIMVHIPVPAEKQGKKGYIIYRSHTDQDGKTTVDKITEEKNADGEYIEVAKDGSAITLYTKKFSTYVLAFDPDKKDEPAEPDTPDKPDTPDTPDTPGTPDTPDKPDNIDTPASTEQVNNAGDQQATTEAPKTSSGLDALTKQQQKDAKALMQTLGLTEAEAVEMIQFAIANEIPMETLLVSDTTITSQKNDKDIKGSSFARIQAATSKLDKTSVKLKWNKVNGADGYLVFGNKCGKGNKYQFIKDVKGVKTNLGLKKLKKGTYYKYVVRAYKLVGDKKVTIALSKTVHATTKGGKYGVAKAVKVNKSKVNLKAGKTFAIKASEIKEDKTIKRHRGIVYESSNTAIATVDKNGVVKAVKKGSCYVYVYAQNGVYKKIQVTVK